MNVKKWHVVGGGGACLRPEHGTGPPPPTIQVNCTGRLHCAGGGGRERRTFYRIKKHRQKNTLLFLPPSLSIGADLVKGAVN